MVHQFDLDGAYQGVFAPIGGANTSIMGNIRGMVISPTGTLLVASATGSKVVEFAADGELLGNFIESGAGGIGGPWHMLFREADVLVSDSGGNIYQYDHDGAPLSVWQNTINFPQQLYRQADGNVLAAAFSPRQVSGSSTRTALRSAATPGSPATAVCSRWATATSSPPTAAACTRSTVARR